MRRRSAFTLLELLLALALSVTLVLLLAMAVQLCLSQIEGGRSTVERARLVGGLFEIIAGDLRSIRSYDPQDVSAATEIAEQSAAFDVDSLDSLGSGSTSSSSASGSTGSTGSTGASASSSSSSSSSSTTTDDTALTLRRTLGVFGSISQLQIDVARVSPDWQALAMATGQPMDTLPPPPAGNMVTVVYGLSTASGSARPALIRHERDRDLLAFEETQGTATNVLEGGIVLAREVLGVEFRYFDGTQLVELWDMDEQQQLPQAIQVTLYLEPPGTDDTETVDTTKLVPYVLTVPVRGLENAANDEQAAADAEAAAAAGEDTGTSGTSGTGGTTP